MKKTVLIVDDEQHIRDNLKEFLEDDYDVFLAASFEEAKKIIGDLSGKLDYAITDLKLDNSSEYSGIAVFKWIKQQTPKTHCIVLSAYPLLEGDYGDKDAKSKKSEVESQFEESLKDYPNKDEMLEEVKKNYISKGGEKNYIKAIMEKLLDLEER
jgi:CheY-like chemotaxis protein